MSAPRLVDRNYIDFGEYVDECINSGYLTDELLPKYPLRRWSLFVFIRIYCRVKRITFKIKYCDVSECFSDRYFITDIGLDMFYTFIRSHKFKFLRNYFGFLLCPYVNRIGITCPETHPVFNNFRGDTGDPKKQGLKRPGRVREYTNPLHTKYIDKVFPTLYEARQYLRIRLMYKPPESFRIYAQRKHKHYDINSKGERKMLIETVWREVKVLPVPRGNARFKVTPEENYKRLLKARKGYEIYKQKQRLWIEDNIDYLRSL